MQEFGRLEKSVRPEGFAGERHGHPSMPFLAMETSEKELEGDDTRNSVTGQSFKKCTKHSKA